MKTASLIYPRPLCYGWAVEENDTLWIVNVAIASKSALTGLE